MAHVHLDEYMVGRTIAPSHAPTYARIVAEISERMVELWEIDREMTIRMLRRWAAITHLHGPDDDGPAALYWYWRMQSGDYAALTESMSNIGARDCRSKQAVQQELERATATLSRICPTLAIAIHQLRRSIKSYTNGAAA